MDQCTLSLFSNLPDPPVKASRSRKLERVAYLIDGSLEVASLRMQRSTDNGATWKLGRRIAWKNLCRGACIVHDGG